MLRGFRLINLGIVDASRSECALVSQMELAVVFGYFTPAWICKPSNRILACNVVEAREEYIIAMSNTFGREREALLYHFSRLASQLSLRHVRS